MLWQTLAILAAFLFAVSNVIDKYVVSQHTKNVKAIILLFAPINAIYALTIFLIFDIVLEITMFSVVAFITGILVAPIVFFWYTSVVKEDVSRIVPLIVVSPAVVAVLSRIFLNEVFAPLTYFGILLLILGGLLLSFRFESGVLKKSPALGAIIAIIAILSVYNILIKWVLLTYPFWTFLFYSTFGYAITQIGRASCRERV